MTIREYLSNDPVRDIATPASKISNQQEQKAPTSSIKSYSKANKTSTNKSTLYFSEQEYEIMIGRRASDHYLISEKPL